MTADNKLHNLDMDKAPSTTRSLELFDRWERQQWAIRDLHAAKDRDGWDKLPAPVRDQLRVNMVQFFIGELAVTETLAPLAHAAPDREAQLFLCTQLADEARHSLFFLDYLNMVEGRESSAELALEAAWGEASEGQVELFDRRLRALTDRVRVEPSDTDAWYAAVTLYHLVLEGVLATAGQRVMLRLAKTFGDLPVLVAGLEHVARDESRHVSFGMGALKHGVALGHRETILAVVESSIEPLVEMAIRPEDQVPELALRGDATYYLYAWDMTRRALRKRLRALGLEDAGEELDRAWRAAVGDALEQYGRAHGDAHPARELWLRAPSGPAAASA